MAHLLDVVDTQNANIPILYKIKKSSLNEDLNLVEVSGVEPLAYALRTRRSTN